MYFVPVPYSPSQWQGINYSTPNVDEFSRNYPSLVYIELIFMALSLVSCGYLLYVVSKISLFHQNIVILINVAYWWFVIGSLTRFYIILVTLRIVEKDWNPTLLFVCSFIRVEYLGFIQTIQTTISVERIFATYYVSDYEKNHRSWIICIILPLTTLITQTVALPVFFLPNVPLIFALGYCTSMTVLSFFILNYLYASNSRKLAHLKLNPIQYTLSKKFQLEENIRIMWYLRVPIFSLFGALLLINMLVWIPSIFETYQQIDIPIGVGCIDVIIVVTVTFFTFGMFCAMYYVRHPAFMRQHKMLFGDKVLAGKHNRVVPKCVDETNEYFNQLNKSWM